MTCSCTAGCQRCKRQGSVLALAAALPTTFTAPPPTRFDPAPVPNDPVLIEPAFMTRINFAINRIGPGVLKAFPSGRKLRRMKASDERRKTR